MTHLRRKVGTRSRGDCCCITDLASGLFREWVEGRLALALRRLVSRHMGLRLVLVRFRFLFFLISILSLRHGNPPVCSLTGHSSTASEQLSCISPVPAPPRPQQPWLATVWRKGQ